jgi:iron complex outermembrane receptor protein
MSSNTFKKGLLASSIAMILAGASSQAIAAEETAKVNKDEVEVIQVTGIRGSLKASLNAKRFSNAVIDAVSSEDIGKFPDGDVGESLARIPGVAVNRQFGQGSQVSIRGASAQLTRTLLNGHTVASTGWYDQQDIDRSFNYSMLPSELVGGIEVYKSSQADIVEGGVGGTVIVKTRKPLDLDANTVFASVKGDYGTVSEEVDPEVSALYSWKNEDENFGVLVAGALSEKKYQRNGIESLLGWGEIVPSTFLQERNRTALNLAVQYRPTDELEFGLTVTTLELEADNTNTSLFVMFPEDKDAICEQKNVDGTCTFYRHTGVGGNSGYAQTWARSTGMESNTYDFDWKYEADNFTLSGRVGNTKSEGGTNLTANYGQRLGTPADYKGTYDATGDVIVIDVANKSFTEADFQDQISSAGWALKKQPNSDEETYVNIDLEVPVEFGAISSIKTGFRYADHSVKQQTLNANSSGIVKQDASEFFSGTISSGAGYTLPNPNFDAMISDAHSFIDSYTEVKDGFGTVDEENLAVYVMADFEGDGVRGNFGVRYVTTDASSSYYDFVQGNYADNLTTDSVDYSEVLPSINVAFDLAEDVILRTSAAQVMSRPNYTDMFSSYALPGYNDGTPGNERVQRGNIALNPFKAFQADFGVEWYFSEDGMFSATYFLKEVNSFVTTVQVLNQQVGIEDPTLKEAGESTCGVGVYDCWTLINKENATGGTIKGIEFQLQDAYDNGLGYSVNYTYADASAPGSNYPDQVDTFSDSSEHTINTVGYYENDDFSARLAYNWRSEYMIRESGFYGQRQHKDYGTLDFSGTWSATDYLDVTFEAANILEEDSIQVGVATGDAEVKPELRHGYPAWSFEGEARYKVGVAVRF